MQNPFAYSDDNKRYHTLHYHLRHRYGGRVFKVPLNAGFTCPNMDGTKGVGGCTYCSSQGSGDFAGDPSHSLARQFEEQKAILHQKWPKAQYIPYFQARTNTYAPVEILRERFEPVLEFPGVVGLAIATRADCLPDEVCGYLEDLSRRTDLTVELGLQSFSDETGERINRGHTTAEFLEGFWKLHQRGIPVCVHIINGLPGEGLDEMRKTAEQLARLPIQGIKIHLLHVLEGTVLADQYRAGEFPLLTRKEYVSVVCDQLELLPPQVVIQRLTGDGDREKLIGPLWSVRKREVLNEIDKELARRGSWQGKKYREGEHGL